MPDNVSTYNDKLPTVALVGRVNVGKSTLFNKLIEEQKAIVSNTPGTTRTRNEGIVIWRGKEFKLFDTGGLTLEKDIPLEEEIVEKSEAAVKDADVIVFVIDGQVGVLPQEMELAKKLRRKETPVLFVVNKIDSKRHSIQPEDHEWKKLGLGAPVPVSASSGRNIGDFLDTLYYLLQKQSIRPKKPKTVIKDNIVISLIGKPNVGKSSLFNKLIGEDKVIVSEMEHTTREPHDTHIVYEYKQGSKTKKQHITFVDTAGIRRKAKVKGALERSGIGKSIGAVEDSDLVLFVLDGSQPISAQDKQLGGLVEKRGKSVIILVNKWDLAEDNSEPAQKKLKQYIYAHFPHLDFAPIIFVSGQTGHRVHTIFPSIVKIWQARHTTIPDETLRIFMHQIVKKHLPSRGKGTRHPKILGLRQVGSSPPVFEMVIKYRTSLHRSYVRFVENRLREQFDFTGTPIILTLRKTKR